MAEFNIRQWRLSVLRVSLDLAAATPAVGVALVSFEEKEPRELWRRRYDPREFGIPPDQPPSELELPEEVVGLVASSFLAHLSHETALWLRLVPPYGYLGAAPWEWRLVPVIGRPLLRVPDRLPVAADFGSRWTAAVALSAHPGDTWAVDYLSGFLDELHGQVGDLLDIHVFSDGATAAQVLETRAPEPWWHLHDPREDLPALLDARGRDGLRQVAGRPAVWSEWIRTGLEGRAVRALHIVTDAAFDGDQPMLLVPTDPLRPDPGRAGFVQVEAALRLTDTIGAATLSFGSPPDNISDVATRMLADDIGQRRAGPTLYSSLAQDPTGAALAQTHAYLADPERGLPVSASQFLYAQPEHVSASLMRAWPTVGAEATAAGDEVLPPMPGAEADLGVGAADRSAAPPLPPVPMPTAAPPALPEGVDAELLEPVDPLSREVPAWVAASYRFLGDAWARVARDRSDPAYTQGVSEALDDLRAMVDQETP